MTHAVLLAALDELLAGRSTAGLLPRVDRLRSAYRSQEVPDGHVLRTPDDAAAYAAYRMPATCAAVRACLLQARAFLPEPVASAVDLGAGTGAASWALAEVLTPSRLQLLEQSSVAADLGRALASASGVPALQAAEWSPWHATAGRVDLPGADLAVAAYLLAELDAATQAAVLDAMIGAAPAVLVVEPGTPAGYARVVAARRRLLDAGLSIVAPCPHEGECPLLDRDDWCHFATRVERSPRHRRLKEGSLSYEDEKYSFVLAARGGRPAAANRVLRRPVQRKGLVDLALCTGDGDARPQVVSKRAGELYKAARKADWGGPWPPEPGHTVPG
jgi:ribosomal protein RSM22 (predicted rRNA methylase)